MPFADASVEVEADFSRFTRQFRPALRRAITRAQPAITRTFLQAGRNAGQAFARGFEQGMRRLATTGRQAGTTAGRAFRMAAQRFTRDIDVGFNLTAADAARVGRQFRDAVARHTRRIPVSFAAEPSARAVGRVVGARFRAGATELTRRIPINFNVRDATLQGRLAGLRFRRAAERLTDDIPVRIGSGGGGLGRLLTPFRALSRLPRFLTSAPGLITAIGVAAALTAGPLSVMVGQLIQLGGLLTLLPSGLFTLGAAFGVIAASAQRIGELIRTQVGPAFAGLRDDVARVATAGLAQPLRDLGRVLSGPVRTGATQAASALNDVLTRLAEFGAQARTGQAITVVFNQVSEAFALLSVQLPRLLAGFRELTIAVAPVFDTLIADIITLTGTFGDFLARAAQSGEAFRWAENARIALEGVVRTLFEAGRVIGAVFAPAVAAGGDIFGRIADSLRGVADFLRSPDGVVLLQAFFDRLQQVGQVTAAVLVPVLQLVGQVFSQVGQAAQPLVATLGSVLGQLVEALLPALRALQPALNALGQGLADVIAPLGPIFAQLGPTLTSIIEPLSATLADLFAEVGPPLGELVAALGTALIPAFEALVPIVDTLLEAIQPVIPTLGEVIIEVAQLVVALTPLIELFTQWAVVSAQVLAPVLRLAAELSAFSNLRLVVPVLNGISEALEAMAEPIRNVIDPIRDAGDTIEGFSLSEFFANLGSSIVGGLQSAGRAVQGFFRGLGEQVRDFGLGVLDTLAQLPGRLVNLVEQAFFGALEVVGFAIGAIIVAVATLPENLARVWAVVRDTVTSFFTQTWERAQQIWRTGIDLIVRFVTSLPGRIAAAWAVLPGLIGGIWNRAISVARDTVRRGLDQIVSFFASLPGRVVAFGTRLYNVGRTLARRIGDGIASAFRVSGNFADRIVQRVKDFINRGIRSIESGINRATSRIGINVNLPQLALGDIINEPMVALLGEAGREVVIPLTNPARARELSDESGLTRMLGADAAPEVNVRVYIGERELTDIVQVQVDRGLNTAGQAIYNGPRWQVVS